MTIEELIHRLRPGAEMTVANEPFTYAGRIEVTLEGGDVRYWLYDDGTVLGVSADDEEIVAFKTVDEDLEPQGGMIFFRGKEYEFTYQDDGSITSVDGEVPNEEGDKVAFSDFEADDGSLVRIVTNENTGEKEILAGGLVTEEEILNVE